MSQGFSSVVEPGFWMVYAKKKLEVLKLSEEKVRVRGWYSFCRAKGIPPQFRVGGQDLLVGNDVDLDLDEKIFWKGHGFLYNTNTVEEFKNFDKKKLLQEACENLKLKIENGDVDINPSLLVDFNIVSFADLKRHKFIYWFCFTGLNCYNEESITKLESLDFISLGNKKIFFESSEKKLDPFFGISKSDTILSLKDIATDKSNLEYLCYIDPGTDDNRGGWPLYNFLYWMKTKALENFKIVCIRKNEETSIAFKIENILDQYKPVGWEPNAQGKMGPRMTDLSSQMNPEKLASSACDLNLKLMRWRALPELDTEMLGKVSCLLVGSGTLGCSVARCMLGWGMRNITMLDNGKVSYSNPVRQSLFNFEDCKDGGKPKAEAAAQALKNILPAVNAKGVCLNIPMPGHFVTSETMIKQTEKDVETLENLIKDHDVIILLTDTRESRWLPTMLASKYDKLVLNAALGFDSYMVMRHGCGPDSETDNEKRLGCYFCNDVVAPQNSMKDRTLDQQCTVTRPGLAPIAGALAVELLISLLHHPLKNKAGYQDTTEKLGNLPHQIRGFLPTYNTTNVSGQAFPQCTACSKIVVDEYTKNQYSFLLHVFNQPNFLEDLTGLTKLRESMNFDDDDLLLLPSDDDEDDF